LWLIVEHFLNLKKLVKDKKYYTTTMTKKTFVKLFLKDSDFVYNSLKNSWKMQINNLGFVCLPMGSSPYFWLENLS